MNGVDDLIAFVRARLDEDEERATKLLEISRQAIEMLKDPRLLGRVIPGWHSWPDVEAMSSRVLREVEAKRAIVAEYETAVETMNTQIAERLPGPMAGDVYLVADPAVLAEVSALSVVVGQIAAVSNDHPDYKPEWAPAQN